MQSLAAWKLTAYRRAQRMTLRQFAEKFDIAVQTVNGWEKSNKLPSRALVIDLWEAGICQPSDWYTRAPGNSDGARQGDTCQKAA